MMRRENHHPLRGRALMPRVFALSLIVVTLGTGLGLIYVGFVERDTLPPDGGHNSSTATKAAAPTTTPASTPAKSSSSSALPRPSASSVHSSSADKLLEAFG